MTPHYLLTLLFVLGSLPSAPARANSAREQAEVRKIMFEYAGCVVKNHHKSASEAIVANADNHTISNRYPELISGGCLGAVAGNVSLSFKGDLYRYALADALVNADFGAAGPSDFSDRLPLAPFPRSSDAEFATSIANTKSKQKRADLQEGLEKANVMAWLSKFGECVARQNPAASRLWLLTKPDGPEEMSRIGALRASFAECLDTGGTLRFGKIVLRGAVAINYYRLAMATPQPIPGKTQ